MFIFHFNSLGLFFSFYYIIYFWFVVVFDKKLSMKIHSQDRDRDENDWEQYFLKTVSFNRCGFSFNPKMKYNCDWQIAFYNKILWYFSCLSLFLGGMFRCFKRKNRKKCCFGIGIVDGLKHHKNNHSKWSLHKIVSIK